MVVEEERVGGGGGGRGCGGGGKPHFKLNSYALVVIYCNYNFWF
jgi:hypothetical protein